MSPTVAEALVSDRVIDITTTGRSTGEPRRIEIWFHRVDGRYYITGRPGRRGWFANLSKTPDFTFHLKVGASADLPAHAAVISEEAERRRVLAAITSALDGERDLESWVTGAPLVEVTFV